MSLCAPVEIRVGRQALTLLGRVLDAAAPEEGCGLLLGPRPAPGGAWMITLLWPTANVWKPASERRRRFLIDPREQLQAMRWARCRGLEVLGSLHSHPASAAVPSATDRALAVPPALMLIRGCRGATGPGASEPGVAGAGDPVLRCWWLEEGAQPQLLPWTMVD